MTERLDLSDKGFIFFMKDLSRAFCSRCVLAPTFVFMMKFFCLKEGLEQPS